MLTTGEKAYGLAEVRELIALRLGPDHVPAKFKIITDTSDFCRVEYHDVVVLAGVPYLVQGYEREGRFGIDDEVKHWVRRAIDLRDGAKKILKLVFHESFDARVGEMTIRCFRSPKKEARILRLVADHPLFMHGHAQPDAAGNIIRVLDFIRGRRFDEIACEPGRNHEDYFYHHFPGVLDQFIEMSLAILFLHDHGEKHGDIRRDHILFDRDTGTNRWIDFDYNYMHGESMFGYDLHGLGNILLFLAGRGDITVQDLYYQDRPRFDSLYQEDLNIIFKNRVANLQKIFPYIPESLNRVLLHFSRGANLFYENTAQFVEDLREARQDLR